MEEGLICDQECRDRVGASLMSRFCTECAVRLDTGLSRSERSKDLQRCIRRRKARPSGSSWQVLDSRWIAVRKAAMRMEFVY